MGQPNLTGQVEQLIKDYKPIQSLVEKDPSLRYKLQSMYDDLYKQNSGIMQGANWIDGVDRILGPLEAGLRWFGPGPGYVASGLMRLAEWTMKLPYAAYYTAKTGDLAGTGMWAASEAAATLLPYGDLIDVFGIYKGRAQKYLRGATAEAFLAQYGGQDNVVNIADAQKKRAAHGKVAELHGLEERLAA